MRADRYAERLRVDVDREPTRIGAARANSGVLGLIETSVVIDLYEEALDDLLEEVVIACGETLGDSLPLGPDADQDGIERALARLPLSAPRPTST